MSADLRVVGGSKQYSSGGGDPPDNVDMEARIKALETILPTLATKDGLTRLEGQTREGFADVRREAAELRGDINTGFAEVKLEAEKTTTAIHKWMSATVITIIGAMLAAIFGLSQVMKPAPTQPQQPPVIINNVPAAPAK